MGLFSFNKYKSLSQAVLAGDVRAARKMLERGADPNRGIPVTTRIRFTMPLIMGRRLFGS